MGDEGAAVDYERLLFCTELELPRETAVRAAALAIEENPRNAPFQEPSSRTRPAADSVEAALVTQRYWRSGRTLRVTFLEGDPTTHGRVQGLAPTWTQYANLELEFVDHRDAEVRIGFRRNSGLWSFVGTDALTVDPNHPTMNLGWLDSDTSGEEFSKIVLHMFGHVLGLTHIHQNPAGGVTWDMPRLYDYYRTTMGWNHAKVDRLVQHLLVPRTPFNEYDVDSVMVHAIPPELLLGEFAVRCNTELSPQDKHWISMLFPPLPVHSLPAKEAVADMGQQFRRTYRFGESELTIEFGDITSSNADVIVSSDDCSLTMSGGVSNAIRSAAGEAIRIDAAKHVPASLGDVVITTAGALPAQYVFHAITIGPGAGTLSAREVVRPATTRCMELFDQLGSNTIAFPAIGAGFAGFFYEDVAVEMAQVLAQNLVARSRQIHVTIYLQGRGRTINLDDAISFFEQIAKRVPTMAKAGAIQSDDGVTPSEQDNIVQRRRELVRDLARLTEETQQLVSKIAEEPSAESSEKRLLDIAYRRSDLEQRVFEGSRRIPMVFISYAHEDEYYMSDLEKILTFHVQEGSVSVWHDRDILPGTNWDQEIRNKLDTADIIIMVVSRDFIYSRYVKEVELRRAVERDASGDAIVIPIIARSCPWEQRTELGRLQALPDGGKPIADWEKQDQAWTSVDQGLMARIDTLRRQSFVNP